MALSSAMYAAVTGLSALGTGMQTISNNIANVNTVGFKAMRTNYEDLISQNYYSGGRANQKGTGVRVSTIQSMFTQGAFMSSAQDTDMAIAGEGFFAVRNAITGGINYTRAGIFTLNKDGYVEDPGGNILQGWQLSLPKPGQDPIKIGAPVDVKIIVTNAPPASTTEMKFVLNLDAEAEPSFIYKEHQLAFDYADPIAQAYAEKSRDAAIFEIWNEFCTPIEYAGTVSVKYPPAERLLNGNWTSSFTADHFLRSEPLQIPQASAGLLAGSIYSAKVYFRQWVEIKDQFGTIHYAPLDCSAVVGFRVQSAVNGGPYTVNPTILSSASLVSAVTYNYHNAPRTSSLTTTPLSFTFEPDISAISFVYTPGKVAMMPHTEFHPEPNGLLTKTFGIRVPGAGEINAATGTLWQIGDPYSAKVWFTETFSVPNPAYPADSTKNITVSAKASAMVKFTVQAASYNSAVITYDMFSAKVNVPYTSSYTTSGYHVASIPVSAGMLSSSNTTLSATQTANFEVSSAKAGIGSAYTITMSVSASALYSYSGTATHGVAVSSAFTGNVTVQFSFTVSSVTTVTSGATTVHDLLASASVTKSFVPASQFIGTSKNLQYSYSAVSYKTSAMTLPTTTSNPPTWSASNHFTPVTFEYKGITVPAANSAGSTPTYSGDAYYQNVTFTSAVTFLDVNGSARTALVTRTILVPFEMRASAYNVTTVSARADLVIPYTVFSEAQVGGALVTAYYNSANVDFTPDPSSIYDQNFLETYMSYAIGSYSDEAVDWLREQIRINPVSALNALVVVNDTGLDWPPIPADRIMPTGLDENHESYLPYLFKIGYREVEHYKGIAEELTKRAAIKHGETVYSTSYSDIFKAETGIIEAYLPEWKLEGTGFAAAWDARDPNGNYIDTTGMIVEPMIIYDSLGSQHQLMIYYQKNPHMENVWDYLITCDPLEDARKDINNILLMTEQASFSGLIQKGKITFTGDGTDRHGGVIKDLEAQNLDLSLCRMATIGSAESLPTGFGFYQSYIWQNATIGGYYTGSPQIDPLTGHYMSSSRTYEVIWGGVDESRLAFEDDRWQEAFKTYMDYLDRTGDTQLLAFKIDSTKVWPENQLPNSSATWEERFVSEWNDGTLQADILAFSAAMFLNIRESLPYRDNSALTDAGLPAPWPHGAARPSLFDKDMKTHGSTSLYWSDNVNDAPPTIGFTVIDKGTGERQTVGITDRNAMGPYKFGSGLTITFSKNDVPLQFGRPGQDGFQVGAKSEQIAWTNLTPNQRGLFDFEVAFVTSASMALHPPYPQGMPTLPQTIAFDMGARNPLGLSPAWLVDKEMSTTQYAGNNAKVFKGQDGHAAGSLARISIAEDGVITGIYTNGYQQELYQIGLTRFINPWGLTKLGDNLFVETRYSGAGVMNEPGEGGTGTILANFLEQSTTDVAEEIVNMILTQRGFQANTKTVTTTDTMLNEVIEMKR